MTTLHAARRHERGNLRNGRGPPLPRTRRAGDTTAAGWCFRLILDNDNQPGCLVGSYSRERYTDAIFVYDETHTAAARVLDDGGCVWKTESRSVAEVVHDLLGLPEPGMPGAPSLVIATPELWTP